MPRRALAVLALLLGTAASTARADLRAWSLCTPGTLRSCYSVSIGTVAVYTGAVRTGTAVTITVANLQGSGLPGTGTGTSGLYQLAFTGAASAPIPFSVGSQAAMMTGAGASGALTWQRITTNVVAGGTYAWLELRGTGASPALLGGCDAGPVVTGLIAAQTCGPAAAAVFAFSIAGSLDASQFDNAYVLAYGPRGSANCFTDPGAAPFHAQPCDLLAAPPVPEPVTVILLGTGLLGIGSLQLRRRRPHDTRLAP